MISTRMLGPAWLTACRADLVEEAVCGLDPLEQQVMRCRLEHGLRFCEIAEKRMRDRVEHGLRLGVTEKPVLLLQDVTRHHRGALKRLHHRLGGPTDWTPGPTEIPRTPMDVHYQKAKGPQGTGESLIAAQIELAQRDLRDPGALASDFVESVRVFSAYDNRDEPFYRTNEGRDDAISEEHLAAIRAPAVGAHAAKNGFWVDVDGTNHFASLMKGGRVVWPEPAVDAFAYVDREILPARTTGGVKFTDGRPAQSAPRLDLLLADRADRTPVVAEVKVGGDQNPYYALIQLLMLGAQLCDRAAAGAPAGVVSRPVRRRCDPRRLGDPAGRASRLGTAEAAPVPPHRGDRRRIDEACGAQGARAPDRRDRAPAGTGRPQALPRLPRVAAWRRRPGLETIQRVRKKPTMKPDNTIDT
jgi:hypothetical protein